MYQFGYASEKPLDLVCTGTVAVEKPFCFREFREFRLIFIYDNIRNTGKPFNAVSPAFFPVSKYKYYNIGL